MYKLTTAHTGGKFGKFTLFEHLAKTFGKLIDSQKVFTNLDGFSLSNNGQFT